MIMGWAIGAIVWAGILYVMAPPYRKIDWFKLAGWSLVWPYSIIVAAYEVLNEVRGK